MSTEAAAFTEIIGPVPDPYRPVVEAVYEDLPEAWQQVIGPSLWFQFGAYEGASASSWTPEEAGRNYFDRQLDLAGITDTNRPRVKRVLDVGCGWGAVVCHLPRLLPECPRFDAVNVSRRQLEFCARRLAACGLCDRVRLYQCNARDIALLPDPGTPFDLVIMRGVITHFTYEVFDAAIGALSARTRPGTTIVISENLYNGDLEDYWSAIPDTTDRLACGYRKTLPYLTTVLATHGFVVHDARVLPSNDDAIRWLQQVRANTEAHWAPEDTPGPLMQLRDHASNWIAALRRNAVSVYSILATRAPSRLDDSPGQRRGPGSD